MPLLERLAVPLVVGLACLALGNHAPAPLLWALVLGGVAANVVAASRIDAYTQTAKVALRCGVVLVGFKLPVGDIVDLGAAGIVLILVTVLVTYTATCAIGDRLGLDRGLVTLIAAGFAVCGAAAIAAVEGTVRRRNEDVALAVAMVTIFGTALVVIEPLVARWWGLSDRHYGLWVGASIHEVAQVIAAGSAISASAVAVATAVKLGRVATLAGVCLAARTRERGRGAAGSTGLPRIPWFLTGFLAAVVLRSSGFLPSNALGPVDYLTTVLLAAGMFGLGLALRLRALFPFPLKVVVLSLASTCVAAAVSGAIVALLA